MQGGYQNPGGLHVGAQQAMNAGVGGMHRPIVAKAKQPTLGGSVMQTPLHAGALVQHPMLAGDASFQRPQPFLPAPTPIASQVAHPFLRPMVKFLPNEQMIAPGVGGFVAQQPVAASSAPGAAVIAQMMAARNGGVVR